MAQSKKQQKLDSELADISAKSRMITIGSDGTLRNEDNDLNSIINQTIIATKDKFGTRVGDKPINYFNEINIGNAFEDFKENRKDADKKALSSRKTEEEFKRYMNDNEQIDATSMLLSDQDRLISFSNYRTIYEHISECAQALDVYKDNIMSPDDFTKMIFDVSYDSTNDEVKEKVEKNLKDLVKKYDFEKKADEIIGESLKLSEYYVACLSLDKELSYMLSDPVLAKNLQNNASNSNLLHESFKAIDKGFSEVVILSENVNPTSAEVSAFSALLEEKENGYSADEISSYVANLINNNVEIASKGDFLLERFQADSDFDKKTFTLADIPGATTKKRGQRAKTTEEDTKPLFINGSTIRMLDPSRVLELKVDNICYGYYYIEETGNSIANTQYLGTSSGREARAGVNMGLNNNVPGMTKYTPATSAAGTLGVSEQKLKIITDVFINQLATKIDKAFVRKNKKFKDFIYDLVRQNYIIKKGIKMTYFSPDEVVKFEVPSVYRKITFAAKLYLSMMTNDILIKLGRAHDKRIFYINTGLDANYEQAINKVIDDIKRREYRMDNLNDFNVILNLNPGRWDDYFIPTINGDRPLEIDTLQGMDTDLNSDFLQYLKNSMMAGIGVPTNLIDNLNDISFARTLSSQNSNFVRSVIRYQKLYTYPFTRLMRILYKNEYTYNGDRDSNIEANIDFDAINVHFPSPASLNMTNIGEQIQSVDQNAEFISTQIIPMKPDGSNEEARLKLKSEIVKDLMPGIDWDKYEKIADKLKLDKKKDEVETGNPTVVQPGADPYAGMDGY